MISSARLDWRIMLRIDVVKECGMIIGGDDYRDGACGIQSCTGESRIHLPSHLLLSLADTGH